MIGTKEECLHWLINAPEKIYEIVEYIEKRSLNANALLWACIGDIARSMQADKWEIYLLMLKRYGQYDYFIVKRKAVEMFKKQFRTCEEIGDYEVNGQPAVQLLCYYGSSTLNKKHFSILLDGVISEMVEMGLEPPSAKKIEKAFKKWQDEKA